MKLRDLVIEKETRMVGNIPVVIVKRAPFMSARGNLIGVGIQAQVFEPPSLQKANKVVKIARILTETPEDDGYLKYVNLVLDHPDNPFFPKIYFAKLYQVKNKEAFLMVELERLHEVTGERLIDVAREQFSRLGFKEDVLKMINNSVEGGRISDLLDDKSFRRQLIADSNNPKFKEAMNLLEPLLSGSVSGVSGDLHAGNWMLRLTAHGPHLVISDPVVS